MPAGLQRWGVWRSLHRAPPSREDGSGDRLYERAGVRGLMTKRWPAALAIAVALVPTAIGVPSGRSLAASTRARSARVMTFNIWEGGTHVDFAKVVEAVRAAEADVVGLQEPFGNTRRLAAALGWDAAPRLHIVSRWPILEPPEGRGRWGFLDVGPGRVIAIANVHLSSFPYGPELVRDGAFLARVLRVERRVRLPEVVPYLRALRPVAESGVPTVFTGDFNTPSHRDWTPGVLRSRPEVGYPVIWPVTRAIERAGFVDSFRAVHPDAVARPGITWTPGYPHPQVSREETHDRIDFVWTAGPASTLDSAVVAERGGPYTDIAVAPWPSDHRAVVATLRVRPATPPVYVASSDRRYPIGRDVRITFHSDGGPGERIALLHRGTRETVAVTPTNTTDGTITFHALLEPGGYEAALLGGPRPPPRVGFTVVDPAAPPAVRVARSSFELGDPIAVSWANAPGNRYDWLSVNREGVSPDQGRLWEWRYTGARIAGRVLVGEDAHGPWPLPAGNYEIHLCVDDGYRCLASAPFSVTAE